MGFCDAERGIPMYRLTTSMPYLLNRLGVRLGALFSRRISPYGLTLPMYRVLAALSEAANQRLGDLSAMTSIDLSTMSRLIGAMVKRGLVSRVRLPTDERTVRINLTPKGAELAIKLMREAQHYEEVAISSLKSSAVSKLKADLARIYDALDLLESELIAVAPAAVGRVGRFKTSTPAPSGPNDAAEALYASEATGPMKGVPPRDRAGKAGRRSSGQSSGGPVR
jgi:MarR family transcriptional regulator, organic hydroperoxide resistance regulator